MSQSTNIDNSKRSAFALFGQIYQNIGLPADQVEKMYNSLQTVLLKELNKLDDRIEQSDERVDKIFAEILKTQEFTKTCIDLQSNNQNSIQKVSFDLRALVENHFEEIKTSIKNQVEFTINTLIKSQRNELENTKENIDQLKVDLNKEYTERAIELLWKISNSNDKSLKAMQNNITDELKSQSDILLKIKKGIGDILKTTNLTNQEMEKRGTVVENQLDKIKEVVDKTDIKTERMSKLILKVEEFIANMLAKGNSKDLAKNDNVQFVEPINIEKSKSSEGFPVLSTVKYDDLIVDIKQLTNAIKNESKVDDSSIDELMTNIINDQKLKKECPFCRAIDSIGDHTSHQCVVCKNNIFQDDINKIINWQQNQMGVFSKNGNAWRIGFKNQDAARCGIMIVPDEVDKEKISKLDLVNFNNNADSSIKVLVLNKYISSIGKKNTTPQPFSECVNLKTLIVPTTNKAFQSLFMTGESKALGHVCKVYYCRQIPYKAISDGKLVRKR